MTDHPPNTPPLQPVRTPNGKFEQSYESVQRDANAARMRSRGHTYHEIAEQLGFYDRHEARKAIKRVLSSTISEAASEVREMQIRQLDELTVKALSVLEAAHAVVSHGKLIKDDDGNMIPDNGPVLAAIDRILKIQERRAKLLGLDASTKVEVLTVDAIDAEIAKLVAELDRDRAAESGRAETAEA